MIPDVILGCSVVIAACGVSAAFRRDWRYCVIDFSEAIIFFSIWALR